MSFAGGSFIFIGVIVFLIGYWFLGKGQGEESCVPPLEKSYYNKNGGIAGIVIGCSFILVGLIINLSQPADVFVPQQ